jgi:hypothetical protein
MMYKYANQNNLDAGSVPQDAIAVAAARAILAIDVEAMPRAGMFAAVMAAVNQRPAASDE